MSKNLDDIGVSQYIKDALAALHEAEVFTISGIDIYLRPAMLVIWEIKRPIAQVVNRTNYIIPGYEAKKEAVSSFLFSL